MVRVQGLMQINMIGQELIYDNIIRVQGSSQENVKGHDLYSWTNFSTTLLSTDLCQISPSVNAYWCPSVLGMTASSYYGHKQTTSSSS